MVTIASGTGRETVDEGGHVDYPHEPGRLWDCPACESACHCTGEQGAMPCMWCQEQEPDAE